MQLAALIDESPLDFDQSRNGPFETRQVIGVGGGGRNEYFLPNAGRS